MDIDTEAKVYTVTEASVKSPSNAKKMAKNAKLFGKSIVVVSFAFWLIILIIAIIGIIPLTQLIVGSIHKNVCTINYLIPIYLIVSGVVGLLIVITSICQNAADDGGCCLCLNGILSLFNFAWFIAGNVWVFRVKSIVQFNNPNDIDTYCHSTVYNCAFGTIIATYIVLCLMCCGQILRST